MKKIVKIFIVLICLALISGELCFLFKSSESYNYDYALKASNKIYDYFPLEKMNYRTSFIYQNEKATIEEKIYTRINEIPSENYFVKNIENYYVGEILEEDYELILENSETVKLRHKSRISSISGNMIIIDNLDEITCTVQIRDISVLEELNDIEYSCEIYDKNFQLIPVSYKFNEKKLSYSIDLRIPYGIEIFESQYIIVNLKSNFYIEGLFLKKDFLQEDVNGYYVYKIVSFDSGKMYKKIYVEKIEDRGKYSLISSDELKKDNEVILYVE